MISSSENHRTDLQFYYLRRGITYDFENWNGLLDDWYSVEISYYSMVKIEILPTNWTVSEEDGSYFVYVVE